MFDTKRSESTNNEISYVSPKNKTMAHIPNLNNKISCDAGISILGFKKYWQTFFNFMDINMRPTFKQFLLSETVNSYFKNHNINDAM